MTVETRYRRYDNWAWLYNSTMGVNYAQSQLKTLDKLLLPQLKQGAKILDLCCGTGQLVRLLDHRGYRVIGLDGSEQMLKYAQQNAPQSKFILGDARNFDLGNSVDAVVSTSASLNHIMSLKELKSVFLQVHNALETQGIFFFDLNHHEQLTRWWNSHLTEGEIKDDYAWGITPHYNAQNRVGSFAVSLFQAPQNQDPSLNQLLKRLVYKLLSSTFLTRFRLKVLGDFAKWQPNWKYSEIDYPVKGYTPEEIKLALQEVGFTSVFASTLDGDTTIDNKHSAYFMAKK